MGTLSFSFETMMPIVGMVALGYGLKRGGILDDSFWDGLQKLVFQVVTPVMLFVSLYDTDDIAGVDWRYLLYVLFLLGMMLAVGTAFACLGIQDNVQRATFIHANIRTCYTVVGIPLASAIAGDAGQSVIVLLVMMTPVINVLTVLLFSMAGAREHPSVRSVVLDILTNPLDAGIFAGIGALAVRWIFLQQGIGFRLHTHLPWMMSILRSISGLTAPLALLLLGGQFVFRGIRTYKKQVLLAIFSRLVVAPILAVLFTRLIWPQYTGLEYVGMLALAATPCGATTPVITRGLGGDGLLNDQLVVWTVMASIGTLFLTLFLLRMEGLI